MKLNAPIATIAHTIMRYPKIFFLEWTDKTSETIPKAGRATIYTSGWPKNQNKCWNKIGLPPP